jgi:hypothetical protein
MSRESSAVTETRGVAASVLSECPAGAVITFPRTVTRTGATTLVKTVAITLLIQPAFAIAFLLRDRLETDASMHRDLSSPV